MTTQVFVRQPLAYDAAEAGAPTASGHLPLRLALVVITLTIELCVVAALGHPWVHTLQIATAPIVFVAALLFFGRGRLLEARAENIIRLQANASRFALWHVVSLLSALALDWELHLSFARQGAVSSFVFGAWCVALATMFFTLSACVLQPGSIFIAARRLGTTWVYAAVCALLAASFRSFEYVAWDAPSSWLGNHLAGYAFSGVRFLLDLLYKNIEADPATRILGTSAFRIHVAGTCSGIEGLGLTLALTLGWVTYERKQLRVLRTLLLTPLALLLMWGLNLVRMTALVAIGLSGHPALALTGFHTEAGWIAFTLVAIGFLFAASRIAWFQLPPMADVAFASDISAKSRAQGHRGSPAKLFAVQKMQAVENISVEYLAPFIVLLGTSFITRTFSTTGFEVLYPLRLMAVGVVFFVLRKSLVRMRWSVRLRDVALGAALGGVWMYFARHADGSVIADGLRALTPASRALWIAARALCAVVCVPLAEELAFRGFLARWLVNERFDTVRYSALTLTSIAISSLAFGAMHGHMWLMGAASGVLFAWLAKRNDSLGSAIAAHTAANLVLAIVAITRGAYGLW